MKLSCIEHAYGQMDLIMHKIINIISPLTQSLQRTVVAKFQAVVHPFDSVTGDFADHTAQYTAPAASWREDLGAYHRGRRKRARQRPRPQREV